jgi:hypothetical protein
MTERTDWYRSNAEKCLALAHRSNDLDSKRSLLAMANAWLALAEQVSKKTEPAGIPGMPPHRVTPVPPDKPDGCK